MFVCLGSHRMNDNGAFSNRLRIFGKKCVFPTSFCVEFLIWFDVFRRILEFDTPNNWSQFPANVLN